MESRSQKPFALIFLLGLLILTPHLFTRQEPASSPSYNDAQLVQVAQQRPYLLFQPIPINTADAKQFGVIPGIGPELSKRIVAYRTEHGPFRSLDELGEVNGIGPQKLVTLREYCRL